VLLHFLLAGAGLINHYYFFCGWVLVASCFAISTFIESDFLFYHLHFHRVNYNLFVINTAAVSVFFFGMKQLPMMLVTHKYISSFFILKLLFNKDRVDFYFWFYKIFAIFL
jgi:hypothetical protein